MNLDDLLGTKTEQAPQATQQQVQINACDLYEKTMRSLGYEVNKGNCTENRAEFSVKKNNIQYTLSGMPLESASAGYFCIPVSTLNNNLTHLFNTETDCVAFFQKEYENGSVFLFKTADLKTLIKPIFEKLKNGMLIAFNAQNAITENRIYVHNTDSNSYIMYLYVSIEDLCKNLKHNKQKV